MNALNYVDLVFLSRIDTFYVVYNWALNKENKST